MVGASRVVRSTFRPLHCYSRHHHPAASFLALSSKVPMSSCRKVAMASVKESASAAVISISPNDQVPRKKPLLDVLRLSVAADQMTRTATRLFLFFFHHTAATRRSYWHLQATEMLIERVVFGCRSFLLIAVAGSLIGSVLCFLEGCFLVLESYFHTILHSSDQGRILQLLIESIDMFLVGTSLLTFGMGLYVIFAGSKEDTKPISESSYFGQFNLKRLSNCMEMQSIAHAKSKLGHAVLLILQAGFVDKFKNVPLTSSLDLVCFTGAVVITSASVFVLSKLAVNPTKTSKCV